MRPKQPHAEQPNEEIRAAMRDARIGSGTHAIDLADLLALLNAPDDEASPGPECCVGTEPTDAAPTTCGPAPAD